MVNILGLWMAIDPLTHMSEDAARCSSYSTNAVMLEYARAASAVSSNWPQQMTMMIPMSSQILTFWCRP